MIGRLGETPSTLTPSRYPRTPIEIAPVSEVPAVQKARAGGGPTMIEALTYRHGGHSRADPGKYRPADEVEAWLERDPIPMYHQRLLRVGASEVELANIQQKVAAMVDEATEFAKAGQPPGEEHLMTDVWADGGSAWRN